MSGIYSVPGVSGDLDDLLEDAVKACIQYDRASASLLQRRLLLDTQELQELLINFKMREFLHPLTEAVNQEKY